MENPMESTTPTTTNVKAKHGESQSTGSRNKSRLLSFNSNQHAPTNFYVHYCKADLMSRPLYPRTVHSVKRGGTGPVGLEHLCQPKNLPTDNF